MLFPFLALLDRGHDEGHWVGLYFGTVEHLGCDERSALTHQVKLCLHSCWSDANSWQVPGATPQPHVTNIFSDLKKYASEFAHHSQTMRCTSPDALPRSRAELLF